MSQNISSITDLTPAQRESLSARSAEVVVVYPDHRLPTGSGNLAGRVGIGPADSGRALYVDRGIAYTGPDEDVAEWLAEGVRYFTDFDSLVDWAADVTRRPAGRTSATEVRAVRPPTPTADDVTDLALVESPVERESRVTELDVRSALLAAISGQDRAISMLASGVTRHLDKQFARRPYSAVLMGKTGVGKTETTRLLAEALSELSGLDWQLVRLDMAEFSERISVTRLVGAPPGYIGHGDGTDLAAQLAENPRTIVLLDEFEKAHPSVWQALLGLLDRGRLASERHGTVTAEQSVLIFTTNIGAHLPSESLTDDATARAVLREHGLAPELVGRFGNIIGFRDLDNEAMAAIAARSVGVVGADYGVRIEWIEPAYLTDLLQRLAGNTFGARMVEYLVEVDLGEQLGMCSHRAARLEFEGAPVIVPVIAGDPT